MGSFSNKKDMAAAQAQNQAGMLGATASATGSLKPYSFDLNGNSLSVDNGKVSYKPADAKQLRNQNLRTSGKIRTLIDDVPTEFSPDALYYNEFYDSSVGRLNRDTEARQAKERTQLNDTLNARNQIGSSYDALTSRDFADTYNREFMNNQDQAREVSANAYLNGANTRLAAIQGLRTDQVNMNNIAFQPLQLATGYQQALSPLQLGQGQAYNQLSNSYGNVYGNATNSLINRPTGLDQYMRFINSGAEAAKAAAAIA